MATRPTTRPPQTDVRTRLARGIKDDDGRCHLLDDDDVPLCGKQIRSGGRRGNVHTTLNPGGTPCDACGRPRCPRCLELYNPDDDDDG